MNRDEARDRLCELIESELREGLRIDCAFERAVQFQTCSGFYGLTIRRSDANCVSGSWWRGHRGPKSKARRESEGPAPERNVAAPARFAPPRGLSYWYSHCSRIGASITVPPIKVPE